MDQKNKKKMQITNQNYVVYSQNYSENYYIVMEQISAAKVN